MSKITDAVWALAEPVVKELGLELWDVEYVREGGTNYLRVYIDRPGEGVFIDDCEAVSKALDPMLDEADPIPDAYTFEVSSAGAERQLKRERDFAQFMGSKIEVKLYRPRDGKKVLQGILAGYEDGDVLVDMAGETVRITKTEAASVRLVMDI